MAEEKYIIADGFKESNRIFEEAKKVMPGGVTKARVAHISGQYPIYMTHAKGSHVTDVDGNEYIDWMSGYGCILLGHCYDEVDDAVVAQIGKSFISFLSHPIQNELANKLIEYIPCAEMVRFFKTGTDATVAAVRIARIHTGRDKVIRWGYHGWADFSVSNFYGFDAGVPQTVRNLTLTFEYNNIESLKKVFAHNPGQIACVIMMPLEVEEPKQGFLNDVKQVCRDNGAVLIFDEIRSGFRVSSGGAQEYYDVIPDLASINKGMANGYAISAVVGKKEIMEAVEKGLFSATFFVSTLEMAAAMATLNIIKRDGVINRLWELGQRFQEGLKQIIAGQSLEVDVVGLPPMPFLNFRMKDDKIKDKAKRVFYSKAAQLGVYFHPNHHWFVNFSHTEEDVDRTLDVCRKSFKLMQSAL